MKLSKGIPGTIEEEIVTQEKSPHFGGESRRLLKSYHFLGVTLNMSLYAFNTRIKKKKPRNPLMNFKVY